MRRCLWLFLSQLEHPGQPPPMLRQALLQSLAPVLPLALVLRLPRTLLVRPRLHLPLPSVRLLAPLGAQQLREQPSPLARRV